MILDSQLVLSDAQAFTADAASTNTADLGLGSKDTGAGNPVRVKTIVNEAFNTLTSVNIAIQCDDNEAFSSPKTVLNRTIVLADLTLGAHIDLGALPEGTERYVRAYYDVTGTPNTTGKLTTVLLPLGSFDHPLKK